MPESRSRAVLLTLSVAGVVAACSGNGASPEASPSGESGNTTVAGAAGATVASAGTASTSGGSAGSSASSGSGGNGGASGSTSGGANAVGEGGSDGGGSATAGGTALGGSGGGADDLAAAAVLNHYQLLDPCQSSYKAVATPGDVCPQDTAVKNQHITLQFGGDSAITYEVALHVRGIMEGYWYTGGTLDPASKTFYTDGVPTIGGFSSACKNKTSALPFTMPTELTPTDNCWNGFNVFALTVSGPKAHYYLNYTADKNADRPPHAVYSDDYTVTIPIQGRAKLEFYIVGSDEHECYNFDKVINGVSLPMNPYVGDFVQFDVTSVTRAP